MFWEFLWSREEWRMIGLGSRQSERDVSFHRRRRCFVSRIIGLTNRIEEVVLGEEMGV
tara:strand:- start:247 stop:420 length:174 start_codon:yes stop_codon:yes gene_type:complete